MKDLARKRLPAPRWDPLAPEGHGRVSSKGDPRGSNPIAKNIFSCSLAGISQYPNGRASRLDSQSDSIPATSRPPCQRARRRLGLRVWQTVGCASPPLDGRCACWRLSAFVPSPLARRSPLIRSHRRDLSYPTHLSDASSPSAPLLPTSRPLRNSPPRPPAHSPPLCVSRARCYRHRRRRCGCPPPPPTTPAMAPFSTSPAPPPTLASWR